MPSRKFASRRRSRRQSTVGKITPPLDVRSEDSISSLMKLVKKGPITIILVYADWCGHCHTYKPKFDEAAKNRKSPFQVASINETMLNSVNERIKSMNKSANINVSGYPSVVSLNNKGEFVKDLSQDAAIKMLNTPVPKSVMQNTNKAINITEPVNTTKVINEINPSPVQLTPFRPSSLQPTPFINSSSSTKPTESIRNLSKKKPVNLPQTRVSEPILQLMGGSFETPLAPKYLGGSLYKSLSSSPYQLANPLTLFKSLSKTHRKLKTKSKSRK